MASPTRILIIDDVIIRADSVTHFINFGEQRKVFFESKFILTDNTVSDLLTLIPEAFTVTLLNNTTTYVNALSVISVTNIINATLIVANAAHIVCSDTVESVKSKIDSSLLTGGGSITNVTYFSDLPPPENHMGEYYRVLQGEGGYVIPIINYRVGGNDPAIYYSDGTSWKPQRDLDETDIYLDNRLRTSITNNRLDGALDTVDSHISSSINPHSVTAAQVGLDQVDNTSDLDKPISTATQVALDLKADISDTIQETFETVYQNLPSYNVSYSYTNGSVATKSYSNGITVTYNYTNGDITSIVLSGSTPSGIDLTKTITYTSGGELDNISYS